jgi:hypothetical protein
MAPVGQLNALVKDFMALCKVDTVVLPMPYNQVPATLIVSEQVVQKYHVNAGLTAAHAAHSAAQDQSHRVDVHAALRHRAGDRLVLPVRPTPH